MFIQLLRAETNFVIATIEKAVLITLPILLNEFFTLNPEMTPKELFISGMNVGKDIIGTMANTLILVYLGRYVKSF